MGSNRSGSNNGDAGSGASGDGLINPEFFWGRAADLDTEAIRTSSNVLRGLGASVSTEMDNIDTVWNELPQSYESPEAWQVYTLMAPAVTKADGIQADFEAAAVCLVIFAEELDVIKPKLADLEVRATAFRARVIGGVESTRKWMAFGPETKSTVKWNEDPDTVDANTALLNEYFDLVEQITMSSSSCANAIKTFAGTLVSVADGGSQMLGVLTAEELAAAGPLPFGHPVEEDRDCGESVDAGASDFAKGTVDGAGMLVLGYNPENGTFGNSASYAQAWGGLGNLGGSSVVFSATGENGEIAVSRVDGGDASAAMISSLVGYDHFAAKGGGDGWHAWKEDGVRAATSSVLNIGSIFIPGATVAAGAKAGSLGARAAAVTSTVAEVVVPGGSWLVKGGVSAVRVGGLGAKGAVTVIDGAGMARAGVLSALDNVARDATFSPTRPRLSDSFALDNVIKPGRDASGNLGLDLSNNQIDAGLDHGAVKPVANSNNGVAERHGMSVDGVRVDGAQGGLAHYGDPRTDAGRIPDVVNSPLFDSNRAVVVEGDLRKVFGGNPYVVPDYIPESVLDEVLQGGQVRVPEKVPVLVGAVDGGAGRVEGVHLGQVMNSVDTLPVTGHPGVGGGVESGGRVDGGTGTGTGTGGRGPDVSVSSGGRGSGGRGSGADGLGRDVEDVSGHRGEGGGSDRAGGEPGAGVHGQQAGQGASDGVPGPVGHAPDAINSGDPNVVPGGGEGWPDPARDFARPEVDQVVKVEGRDLPGSRTAFTSSKFVLDGGLRPNTLYHVEGRGDFYTDATGEITYVEAAYGGDRLNWDLHSPKANTTYVVHPEITYPSQGASYSHVFVTDGQGRTVYTHTDRLARGEGVRSEHVQARIGAQGGPGYDGGHDMGTWTGGGGESLNLTAQLREINQNFPNSFYQLEATWRQLLPDLPGPHPNIEVNVYKSYEPGNPVPLEYLVEYRIGDNDPIEVVFENV